MTTKDRLVSIVSLATIVLCICAAVAVGILSAEERCIAGGSTRLVLVDDLTPLNGATLGSLDSVSDGRRTIVHPDARSLESVLVSGRSAILSGWAIDSPASRPAAGVYVSIDGSNDIRAMYGLRRPDVAAALHSPNYAASGFEVALPARAFEPGYHIVEVRAIAADLAGYYLVAGPLKFVLPAPAPRRRSFR